MNKESIVLGSGDLYCTEFTEQMRSCRATKH